MEKIDLAIVIPFYNEENFVVAMLRSLSKQIFTREIKWGIVFVDNASTDNTVSLIRKICKKNKLVYRIIREDRKGTVFSRISGLNYAAKMNPQLLVSTDADTELPNDFVESMMNVSNKSNPDVIVGTKISNPVIKLWERLVSPKIFNIHRKFRNLEYSVFGPSFFGCCFAIKTSTYKILPLLNPELHERYFGEDITLSRRCKFVGSTFIRSNISVNPSSRRILLEQKDGILQYVGNSLKPYDQSLSYKSLNFNKLTKKEEEAILEKLFNFFAERFLWSLADAYVFWKKTNMIYNNSIASFDRGLEFIASTNSLSNCISEIEKSLKQEQLFTLLKNSCFSLARESIMRYCYEK